MTTTTLHRLALLVDESLDRMRTKDEPDRVARLRAVLGAQGDDMTRYMRRVLARARHERELQEQRFATPGWRRAWRWILALL